ncbi:MAG: TIGR03905 family TSCPD domain-containing protein [Clostridia bacterium]
MFTYKTKGTCSSKIEFDVADNKITHLAFYGGCRGNLTGICAICLNKDIDEIINLFSGIECRGKTSCPDQLAIALTEYKMLNK